MSISYPLTPPSSPGPRKQDFIPINLVGLSVGEFDGQQQTQEWPGEWWELNQAWPPMPPDTARAVTAFLSALRGLLGTFEEGPHEANLGTATSATVNGAHSAGSKTLAVTMTGTLKAGDFIQLSESSGSPLVSHKRLHQVLTDASGSGTLDIFPRLRGNLSGGESITMVNPKGTWRLMENKRQWSIDEAHIYGISITAREAI